MIVNAPLIFISPLGSRIDSEGKLSVSEVEDLLQTLRRVHSLGIVHRDIRPSNLLRRKGGILLCDWNASVNITIRRPVKFAGTLHYAGDIPLEAVGRNDTYYPSPRDDLESLVRLVASYRWLSNCVNLLNCSDASSTRKFWNNVASKITSVSTCFTLARAANYDDLLNELRGMYAM